MVVEATSHYFDTNQRDRVEKPSDGEYQEVRRYAFGCPVPLPEPIGITLDTTPLQDWVD